MTKLRALFFLVYVLLQTPGIHAQGYGLRLNVTDQQDAVVISLLNPPSLFDDRNQCVAFVNTILPRLNESGYITASLDSIRYDSLSAQVWVYAGRRYEWALLDLSGADSTILMTTGLTSNIQGAKKVDFADISRWQKIILDYLENNGHPFAKVWIDSVRMNTSTGNEAMEVSAKLNIDKGPHYTVDSIRVVGDAKVSPVFLHYFLDIPPGMEFNREKLATVSQRLRELSYLEEAYPARIIWLGSGSILELNLKHKKSSQVNVLVGFLPNSDQFSKRKLLVTGEANLLLMNALGAGETIGLNWQQLQLKSPRLNLLYQHPFLFQSRFGIDFLFDMFRRDSSFLNINFRLGTSYHLSSEQSGKIFMQREQTVLSNADTGYVKEYRKLPASADMHTTSFGLAWQMNTTNYRRNPVRGNEMNLEVSIGKRKIKKNDEILGLKDENDPSFNFASLYDTVKLNTYQFRMMAAIAKYFPLGKTGRTTFKTAAYAGWLQTTPLFRNELFQIGGFRLLRGFDEQSQYLSAYTIGSGEFRYLAGQNSYFYAFVDGGWGADRSQGAKLNHTYIGTGLGMAFETKAGIFNLAWAIGRRSDAPFNLRQSKIHFGFLNYF